MGDVLLFRKPDLKQKAKGKTLCKSGAHKWQVCKKQIFDVKAGKLVSLFRCQRCGEEKIKATWLSGFGHFSIITAAIVFA